MADVVGIAVISGCFRCLPLRVRCLRLGKNAAFPGSFCSFFFVPSSLVGVDDSPREFDDDDDSDALDRDERALSPLSASSAKLEEMSLADKERIYETKFMHISLTRN